MAFFNKVRNNLVEIAKDPFVQFVDVRTVEEFAGEPIDGAKNIPLHLLGSRYGEIIGLGENPVIFYCRSGNRSAQAVDYLHSIGYRNVYNGGGVNDVQLLLNI